MRQWLWIVPFVALTGCAKQDVATSHGPVGYAQAAPVEAASPSPVTLTAMAPALENSSGAVVHPVRQIIPGGTPLHVRIDQTIDTDRNRSGDEFTATLTQPVQRNGHIMVPAGTVFHGHVTNANSSKRLTGKASLGLVLDTFEMNGRTYLVTTSNVSELSHSHKKRNSILIGGGAGVGSLVGALAGGGAGALIGGAAGAGAGTAGAALTGKKEVRIGAETPLTFNLKRAVELQ